MIANILLLKQKRYIIIQIKNTINMTTLLEFAKKLSTTTELSDSAKEQLSLKEVQDIGAFLLKDLELRKNLYYSNDLAPGKNHFYSTEISQLTHPFVVEKSNDHTITLLVETSTNIDHVRSGRHRTLAPSIALSLDERCNVYDWKTMSVIEKIPQVSFFTEQNENEVSLPSELTIWRSQSYTRSNSPDQVTSSLDQEKYKYYHELYQGDNLQNLLETRDTTTIPKLLASERDFCNAFLHVFEQLKQLGSMHLDIKPENILAHTKDNKAHLRLIDLPKHRYTPGEDFKHDYHEVEEETSVMGGFGFYDELTNTWKGCELCIQPYQDIYGLINTMCSVLTHPNAKKYTHSFRITEELSKYKEELEHQYKCGPEPRSQVFHDNLNKKWNLNKLKTLLQEYAVSASVTFGHRIM